MSENERKPDSEQPQTSAADGESGHDEPVVVDNGPATVLFGKKHTVTSSNNDMTWTREEASDFFALYVQEETANREVTFVDSWSLATSGKEISLLRVTLESNEKFEFKIVPAGSEKNAQMDSFIDPLKRDSGNGRLKFKNGKELAVKQVEGFTSNGSRLINYTPMTNPKHIKVVILLRPDKP